MKKSIIISFLVSLLLVFSTFSFACEPPGCGQVNSEGYINGTESQSQDWSASSPTDKNVTSSFNELQKHDAYGVRLKPGFTGDIGLYSEQYGGYNKVYNFADGGTAEHYGEGYQLTDTYSEIGEKCGHLSIDAKNSFSGTTSTAQGANYMNASQEANGRNYVRIEGENRKLSANIEGQYAKRYFQKDPSGNWQGGNISMNTKTTINPKTP